LFNRITDSSSCRNGFFALIGVFALGCAMAASNFTFFENDTLTRIQEMKAGTHNPYREFNYWVNDLVFGLLGLKSVPLYIVQKLGTEAGYYASCYVRDYIAGICVYWLTAGLWALTIYFIKGKSIFTDKGREFPPMSIIVDQILLANTSLPLYAALPILSEFLIESKLTRVYFYADEVGGMGMYFLYLFLYVVLVEIGIYWMHRTLHTNKWMYTYIHALHHKYNTATQMTPFASIAFNPFDGLLQASPYVVCLFLVPVHYYTHVYLLFNSGVWATCIHDSVVSISQGGYIQSLN
jgi:lathosterol oxidase